jgi:Flp pilus assembly pilin Flp
MTKLLRAAGFKSRQHGLTVVEYVLGAIALALIIGVAVAAFGDPLRAAMANIL